jgi:PKD repeat protein
MSLLMAQNQTINFDSESRIIEDTEPEREVIDEGVNGVQVNYSFPGALLKSILVDSTIFQNLYIKNFSHTQEVGLPSLPSHIDIIIIPEAAVPTLQIINAPTLTYSNFTIYPALEPASDEYGAGEPDFTIDSGFYNANTVYPSAPVVLREIIKYKGISFALVEVHPVQYNPALRKIYVHSNINYKLFFNGATQFINKNIYSDQTLKTLPNLVINNGYLKIEIQSYFLQKSQLNQTINTPDYLIITHTDYQQAADSLAAWKERQGFKTEIISSSSWTSSAVNSIIHSKYQNYTPKPDYFVILGDNDKVPGQILGGSGSSFASDLYYACMDGSGDYVPDMAYGRISVANATQAMNVVRKIINYDRNPVTDSNFYSHGLNCAYFQHAGNGYAERRFAQTSEEIRSHIVNRGYSVDRVYVTGNNVSPLYWNNGMYSAGEAIPNYLRKPAFPWNGTGNQISSFINAGRFYVFHRDHGMSSGWGDPYYTKNSLNSLNNGNKLPVVFSINCLTGKYMDAECFAEKLLRINNGGSVGVFAHGEVSYSGYNDGLALGLVDAIWSNPGLVPNFTGTGGVNSPNLTAHVDIYRMGDVKNQALLRMIETWGGTTSAIKYTHELFNYFGDPAMEIKTATPVPITAMAGDTINCHFDTSFVISNCSYDGVATLVVDDEMISRTVVSNGSAVLYFNGIAGSEAYITITGHNKIPYVKKVVIAGGCPKARFSVFSNNYCLDDSVLVTDHSSGSIAAKVWNFGSGAIPATATGNGPFYVKYSTAGAKTITLTVTDSSNYSVSYTKDFTIDQLCKYMVPATGNITVDKCTGVLYDDGGIGNYSDNTLGSITISPSGASSVTLNFTSFAFESGYDYLKIYDGPNTNSTLIGTYTGTTLPNNGQITSTSGSITVQQMSDSYTNMSGFKLTWQCNYPNSAPQCDFVVDDSMSCDGVVGFHDYSANGPSSWLWYFGDGTTSTQQHPQHIYPANGVYTVKLVVSNAYGNDSVVKQNLITVSMPNAPVAIDNMRCKTGTVDLTTNYNGPGTLYWYDSISSTNYLDTGLVFTTPAISVNKTYYTEVHENKSSKFVGKTDNSGPGGYFTSNYTHYLVFDCYKPVKLHSVMVYSNSAKDRTIKLLNSGGNLIQSKTVFIPAGKHKIILDFDIPVGVNLRLAGPSKPNLFRNNSGVSYPYKIDNVLSIKHSSASSAPMSYYYYFYDWEIVEGECVSPRIPVNAYVYDTLKPVADFGFTNFDPKVDFKNTGNYGSTYYWDFGDGDFSLLENPSHTYKTNGTFTVTLTSTNDCGQRNISKQVTITTANLQTNEKINSLVLYPVPALNSLNVDFNSTGNQKIVFEVVDLTGRVVYHSAKDIVSGNNHIKLNLINLSSGFYSLRLTGKEGVVIRRFVVE